ncbi:MAG TPA: flagellar basal-body rod protein FlgF [Magnetovibrio sp.]
METTTYIALSNQGALRREMDSIANNMANMNTTGFKRERMMFVDQLTRSRSGDFIADQRLSFVRDIASYRDISEGPIEQTGNTLDIAIHGDGYFTIQTPGGERYTRSGNFRLDNGGQLVTQDGYSVLSDAGAPIFFAREDTTITIAGDGSIATENGQLGKLKIVTFDNEQDMLGVGSGLYSTNQAPIDKPDAQVAQYALEKSNIEAITEMTRMMDVNRRYASTQKMIDSEDERIRKMVRDLPLLNG